MSALNSLKYLLYIGIMLQLSACIAPITPPPGPQSSSPSIPSPSSGGSPSSMPPSTPSPGGMPPSLPGPSGSPSSSPPSSDSSEGSTGSGEPSSSESDSPSGVPGQESSDSAGMPGSENQGEATPAWETSEGGGSPSDDSWEDGQAGGGNPADDEWQTSNVPGGDPEAMPPMPSERDAAGGATAQSGEPGGDGALDEALEVFDGEILAERDVIRRRANEVGSGAVLPTLPSGSTNSDKSPPESPSGSVSMPRNRNPAPVVGASGPVPDDIPDATDDDIIARQLREAAMQELDPILKEKIWDEYRRYKGA